MHENLLDQRDDQQCADHRSEDVHPFGVPGVALVRVDVPVGAAILVVRQGVAAAFG